MNNITAYCDLENLESSFNGKPLYRCKYCGLTVGLEKPDTKIMCFKKIEDITHNIHQNHTQNTSLEKPRHINSGESFNNILLDQIQKEAIKTAEKENDNENICSEEQVNERLAICSTCEYFKENSCLLCGCTVIREINHKNKLAHKDQKCPVDKWGPIYPLSPF